MFPDGTGIAPGLHQHCTGTVPRPTGGGPSWPGNPGTRTGNQEHRAIQYQVFKEPCGKKLLSLAKESIRAGKLKGGTKALTAEAQRTRRSAWPDMPGKISRKSMSAIQCHPCCYSNPGILRVLCASAVKKFSCWTYYKGHFNVKKCEKCQKFKPGGASRKDFSLQTGSFS